MLFPSFRFESIDEGEDWDLISQAKLLNDSDVSFLSNIWGNLMA